MLRLRRSKDKNFRCVTAVNDYTIDRLEKLVEAACMLGYESEETVPDFPWEFKEGGQEH